MELLASTLRSVIVLLAQSLWQSTLMEIHRALLELRAHQMPFLSQNYMLQCTEKSLLFQTALLSMVIMALNRLITGFPR